MTKFVPRSTEDIYLDYLQKAQEMRIAENLKQQTEAVSVPTEVAQVTETATVVEVEQVAPVAQAIPIAENVYEEHFVPIEDVEQILEIPVEQAAEAPIEVPSDVAVAVEPLEIEAPVIEVPQQVQIPVAQPIEMAPKQVAAVSKFDNLSDQQEPSRMRALLRLLGTLLWIATILALLLTTFGFLTRNNLITSFGDYGVFYQRSADMEPEIKDGSLVILQNLDSDDGIIGDDIIFSRKGAVTGDPVTLRRIVNVLRTESKTTYDTIALADRDNTHEQFEEDSVLMRTLLTIPYLGGIIDWLTDYVWLTLAAFLLSLLLMLLCRPKRHVMAPQAELQAY